MPTASAKSEQIRDFIIFNVKKHPKDIGNVVSEHFKVSRVTVTKYLRELLNDGILECTGKTKARTYSLKRICKSFTFDVTPNLQEDVIWSRDIKPHLTGLQPNVIGIGAHGVTEMINNVISHSNSRTLRIHLERNAAQVQILIRDKGVGIFQKIKDECNLADLHHAVLELAKGKLTTDKERHSGEGIFFTSRMFDEFSITSDGLSFVRTKESDDWLLEGAKPREGTVVSMEINTDAVQSVREVFDTYRAEFDEFGFSKTNIPLTLMKYGDEQLISRSQAKRLMARVDQFKEVVLDFKGINSIGQAFADEVFRVYQNANPNVHLYWINTNNEIENMIRRIKFPEAKHVE